jgi:hypothetical protein
MAAIDNLGKQFPPPTGTAYDAGTGRRVNFKGYTDSGHPMYKDPRLRTEEDTFVQMHPDPSKRRAS